MTRIHSFVKKHWPLLVLIAIHIAFFFFYYSSLLMDDMFINIKYAANLASGHGLTYNIGDPFEGYSAFLFVVIEAGMHFFVHNWYLVAKLLGIIFLTGFLTTFYFFVRRYFSSRAFLLTLLLLVAIDPVFVAAGSLGMETSLYLWVTLLTVFSYVGKWRFRTLPLWPLFTLLAVLTRSEGITFAVVMIGTDVLLSFHGFSKKALGVFFKKIISREKWIVYIGTLLYFLWRLSYYGALATGPALSKSAFLPYSVTNPHEFLLLKAKALALFFIMYGIVLLSTCAFAWTKRRDPRFSFLSLFILLYFIVDILVHGYIFPDTAHYWRYHGQIVPFILLLGTLGFESWWKGEKNIVQLSRPVILLAICALLFGIALRDTRLDQQIRRIDSGSVHDPEYYQEAGNILAGLECGEPTILGTTEAGAPPFLSGMYTVDLLGLNYGPVAHLAHNDDLAGIRAHVEEKNPAFFFLFKDRFLYLLLKEDIDTNYHIIYDPSGPYGVALWQRNDLTCTEK